MISGTRPHSIFWLVWSRNFSLLDFKQGSTCPLASITRWPGSCIFDGGFPWPDSGRNDGDAATGIRQTVWNLGKVFHPKLLNLSGTHFLFHLPCSLPAMPGRECSLLPFSPAPSSDQPIRVGTGLWHQHSWGRSFLQMRRKSSTDQ